MKIIRQDQRSWDLGKAAALHGLPSKCPEGVNSQSYILGYVMGLFENETAPGNAVRATRPPVVKRPHLRVVLGGKHDA
jgi:hypothetical protein